MADLLIRDTDLRALTEAIKASVYGTVRDAVAETHEPRLVDGDRMAELAGIKRSSLDRLVRLGSVPSVTIGRRRLFHPPSVIETLITNKNTPTEENSAGVPNSVPAVNEHPGLLHDTAQETR